MKKKYFFAFVLLLSAAIRINAQGNAEEKRKNEKVEERHQMNFIKVNLMGLALKNYSFQYERILSKRFSIAASYRFMPTGTLPFANSISNSFGDDEDAKKTIKTLEMGNYAITPEARLYLGRGYGRGFYMALFYRYASFTVNNIAVDYDDTHSLNVSGKMSGNSVGLMFGAQWPLGKHVCLDWWMFGPHYGAGNGDFNGVSSVALTPIQQDELRKNLEDINVPLSNKTITVNANGANVKLDGPWGGIRTGLSLGVKF
ncbi:MAG: DUF3575 domain-containing protein [Chitinophagaceae bacterium]